MYYRNMRPEAIERERGKARQRSRVKSGRTEDVTWYVGEKNALRVLKGSIRAYGTKYDIEWQGFKIDVKTSILHKSQVRYKNKVYPGSWSWKFRLEKQHGIVDYFLCIGLGKNKELIKVFLIPDSVIKTKSITVGLVKSKYNIFRLNGDLKWVGKL